MQFIFAAARVAVTLAFLIYSSWSDYKTREVTNRVWVIYAPIALSLTLSEFLIYDQAIFPTFILSVGLTTVFALLLFYTGGFGGADSKALICIAFALPVFPTVLITPILPDGLSPLSQTMFPMTILSNAVLIAAASGLYLLLHNLICRLTTGKVLFEGTLAKESIGKKLVVLITGKKFPLETLKAKWHVYPMEDITDETGSNVSNRKLMLMPKDEGRAAVVERLSKAAEAGKIENKVWATPGLPMLIFVTVGLVIALSLGDIIWVLIGCLLG